MDDPNSGSIRPEISNSRAPKRPSLKKRSPSEIMLQEASPLLKQAVVVTQSQCNRRTSSTHTTQIGENPRLLASIPIFELTPSRVKKNIRNVRFHEQVEQRIAVDLSSHCGDGNDLGNMGPVKLGDLSDTELEVDDKFIMARSSYTLGSHSVVDSDLELTPSTIKSIKNLPCTLLKSGEEKIGARLPLVKRPGKSSLYPSKDALPPVNTSLICPRLEDENDDEDFNWISPSSFNRKFSYDKLEFIDESVEDSPAERGSIIQPRKPLDDLKTEDEVKVTTNEKMCSKCCLQTIPFWRNCDMCPECIRSLMVDDSEYVDSISIESVRAAQTWEETRLQEKMNHDHFPVASSWMEYIASPLIHDFALNEPNLAGSVLLPSQFVDVIEPLSTVDSRSHHEPQVPDLKGANIEDCVVMVEEILA